VDARHKAGHDESSLDAILRNFLKLHSRDAGAPHFERECVSRVAKPTLVVTRGCRVPGTNIGNRAL
jgi:hypothetical protein